MSKFCTNCGTRLEDNILFCTNCGARQGESAPAPAARPEQPTVSAVSTPEVFAPPVAGAFNPEAPAAPAAAKPQPPTTPAFLGGEPASGGFTPGTSGAAFGTGAPPAPRKPMPKGVKIALVVVAALVVTVFALGRVLTAMHSSDRTIDRFLDALDAQDYAALVKVTVADGGDRELTEEALAPLFSLYDENAAFKRDLQAQLEASLNQGGKNRESRPSGAESISAFSLIEKKNFLFTSHSVDIQTGKVTVMTNCIGATVALGDQTAVSKRDTSWGLASAEADYDLFGYAEVAFKGVLPGIYDVTLNLETEIGDSFTAVKKLTVTGTSTWLELELLQYNDMYVDNYSEVEITVTAGNRTFRVPAYGSLYIAPIAGDREVVASYTPATGDEVRVSALPRESGYLDFSPCEAYVWNKYIYPEDANLLVSVNGTQYGTVSPGDALYVYPVFEDAVITVVAEGLDFLAPYEYEVYYSSDNVYPDFDIAESMQKSVQDAVESAVDACLAAYNAGDAATFNELQDYLDSWYAGQLEEELSAGVGGLRYTAEDFIYADSNFIRVETDGYLYNLWFVYTFGRERDGNPTEYDSAEASVRVLFTPQGPQVYYAG